MTVAVLHSHVAPRRQAAVSVRRRARPQPRTDLSRLTRYRGGTYSHTVAELVFTDGSTARTDLIRLNPNIEAYSLDFTGVAPTRPSRYRVESWTAVPNLAARAREAEIDWILRNSFPQLGTARLSGRLRSAGYRLGAADLGEHEAIAATQAAIWHFTNGMDLDTSPLAVPDRLREGPGELTVDFGAERELESYTVDLVVDGPATVTLRSSLDGRHWREVGASQLSVDSSGSHRRVLGAGATVSSVRYGRPSLGHRFYRLSVTGGAEITDARFTLSGSAAYRNPERIVHLYNYLLDGARRARAGATVPQLTAAGATVAGLVGPFRLTATDRVALDAEHAELVDADGAVLSGPMQPGTDFYLRAPSGTASATVTMTVPGTADGYGGRVLAGVALDEAANRFTPLALAVPADLVVDFDIDWSTR